MASLVDMVEMMERLESKALHINPVSCVKVRNRNASCTRCADACPSGAISIDKNVIDIEKNKCIACGTCSVVCPTDAIVFKKPEVDELREEIRRSAKLLDGTAVVVCERAISHGVANMDVCAGVPCLSCVDMSVLVDVAAHGADTIALVDADCKTCKLRKGVAHLDGVIEEAKELLEAWDKPVRFICGKEVPRLAQPWDSQQMRGGVSRRGFFTDMKSQAKNAASEAFSATMEVEMGIKKAPETLQSMLKAGNSGHLTQVNVPTHESMMDNLFEIGEPRPGTVIRSSHWGDLEFTPENCNLCGMCAMFCPSGALMRVVAEPEGKIVGFKKPRVEKLDAIEFRLADCVQCGLCEDVCMSKALKVVDIVNAEDIMEFEPRELKGTKTISSRMW